VDLKFGVGVQFGQQCVYEYCTRSSQLDAASSDFETFVELILELMTLVVILKL